jgi:hypothetical protein
MNNSKEHLGIMVSSTFLDLQEHRKIAIELIRKYGYFAETMENDSARTIGVIDSSLEKVQNSAIYMNVISKKYGTVYKDNKRNPNNHSLTELEFDEAIRLNRSILLFVMGTNHPVTENDIELNSKKRKKLNAFREKAKKMNENSDVTRIYAEFNSIENFKEKLQHTLGKLAEDLSRNNTVTPKKKIQLKFRALPMYGGSHTFIGRQDELKRLTEWASADNQNPVFLFEAMGGMGKSMLTWEWATKYAPKASNEWAGTFWYSFYEQGANFDNFCQHALEYITLQPCKEKNFNELSDSLLSYLSEKPWLFILDGLERLLTCYHRYDATDLLDNLNGLDENMRDPCACIRPADDIFLSKLSKASPSKILITSRLRPSAFLNRANVVLPGIDYSILNGFNNDDAIDFFSSCGIRGTREKIQYYLKAQCDNHPLVMGALAGIINQYIPDRGNFDKWYNDDEGAGKLNFAHLDLTHRKHHIVKHSIDILSQTSKEVLSFLSFFSHGIDYNAFLDFYIENKKEQLESDNIQNTYDLKKDFDNAIKRLEDHGLLQRKNRIVFDLHPVIRSIAMDMLSDNKKKETGNSVIDYFNKSNVVDFENVKDLLEVYPALNIISTFLKIGEFKKAMESNIFPLLNALCRIEAYKEIIEITDPLISFMLNNFSFSTDNSRIITDNITAQRFIYNYEFNLYNIKKQLNDWIDIIIGSSNILNNLDSLTLFIREYTILCFDLNKLASVERAIVYLEKISELTESGIEKDIQAATITNSIIIKKISYNYKIGNYDVINELYNQCEDKDFYNRYWYNYSLIQQNILSDEDVELFLQEARDKKDMYRVRKLLRQQGISYYYSKNYQKAFEKLSQSVELSRSTNCYFDDLAESLLLLTQFRLGKLFEPQREVEILTSKLMGFHFLSIAELWWELGEETKAYEFAVKQYHYSWGEGEPYTSKFWLTKTCDFMQKHKLAIPKLPIYNPTKVRKESWEEPLLQLFENKTLVEKAKRLADFSACETINEKEKNLNTVKRMIEEHPNLQEITVIYSKMLTEIIPYYEEVFSESLSENENIQEYSNLREKIIFEYNIPRTHVDDLLIRIYTKHYANHCIKALSQIGYKCYPEIKINDETIPFIALADDEILLMCDIIVNNPFDEIDNNKLNCSIEKLNKSCDSMQALFGETLDDIPINVTKIIIIPNAINIDNENLKNEALKSDIKLLCLDERSDYYMLKHLPNNNTIKDQEDFKAYQEDFKAYQEYIETVIDYFKKQ